MLNSVVLAPGAYIQTFARDRQSEGIDGMVGVWGDAYLEGNFGYLQAPRSPGGNRPAGEIRLVQPITRYWLSPPKATSTSALATTAAAALVFGLQSATSSNPRSMQDKTPVPMDVPRIRYEFGTRRVGSSPPVADAGPNQTNVQPGASH